MGVAAGGMFYLMTQTNHGVTAIAVRAFSWAVIGILAIFCLFSVNEKDWSKGMKSRQQIYKLYFIVCFVNALIMPIIDTATLLQLDLNSDFESKNF